MKTRDNFVPFESIDPEAAKKLTLGVSFQVSAKTFAQAAAENEIAQVGQAGRFVLPYSTMTAPAAGAKISIEIPSAYQ